MSLEPNSRFMNELLVIWPTQPAGELPSAFTANSKNSSMNGTLRAYLPLQVL